jgi:hypothetical protein
VLFPRFQKEKGKRERKRMHVRGNKDLSRKIMLGMLNEKVNHGSKPFQPEREKISQPSV